MTITLYTKDNKNLWAKDYSNSEILINHLIGTRYIQDYQIPDLKILSDAHGWNIEIKLIEN